MDSQAENGCKIAEGVGLIVNVDTNVEEINKIKQGVGAFIRPRDCKACYPVSPANTGQRRISPLLAAICPVDNCGKKDNSGAQKSRDYFTGKAPGNIQAAMGLSQERISSADTYCIGF